MALSALDLHPQEDPRDLAGHLHRLGVVGQREGHRAVLVVAAGRRDHPCGDLVPRPVRPELLGQPVHQLVEPDAVEVLIRRVELDHIPPVPGPGPRPVGAAEQGVDQPGALVVGMIPQERHELLGRGRFADQVEIDAADELDVGGDRRRLDLGVILGQVAINQAIEVGRGQRRRRDRPRRAVYGDVHAPAPGRPLRLGRCLELAERLAQLAGLRRGERRLLPDRAGLLPRRLVRSTARHQQDHDDRDPRGGDGPPPAARRSPACFHWTHRFLPRPAAPRVPRRTRSNPTASAGFNPSRPAGFRSPRRIAPDPRPSRRQDAKPAGPPLPFWDTARTAATSRRKMGAVAFRRWGRRAVPRVASPAPPSPGPRGCAAGYLGLTASHGRISAPHVRISRRIPPGGRVGSHPEGRPDGRAPSRPRRDHGRDDPTPRLPGRTPRSKRPAVRPRAPRPRPNTVP